MKRAEWLGFPLACCGVLLVVAGASAGNAGKPAARALEVRDVHVEHVRTAHLGPRLARVARAAKRPNGLAAAITVARHQNLDVARSKVRVIVEAEPGRAVRARAAIGASRGLVQGRSGALFEALVPPAWLHRLALDPAVRDVRPPAAMRAASTSEGVDQIGAAMAQRAGYDGSGVKVAIVDLGFFGYASLLGTALPASVTTIDHCGGGLASAPPVGTEHGTAVAEIVHAVAPGAQLILICIDSEVGLAQAAQDAIGLGAKVINHSVTWYNTSRGDGSGGPGTPDAIVADARAHGILWVNAAGDNAMSHWGGNYAPSSSDPDVHTFGGAAQTENGVFLATNETACAFLKWDAWPVTSQDFDLFFLRSSDSTFVAVSNDDQSSGPLAPTEEFCYTNTGQGATFKIIIFRYSATISPRLDLFYYSDGDNQALQFRTAASSLSEPASSPLALAVGAYCWSNGLLTSASSQGPSIGGVTKPEIVGPDSVSTATYADYSTSAGCGNSGFVGTSAAAPHVAGEAALIAQEFPSYSADKLEAAIEASTIGPGFSTLANAAWVPPLTGYEKESGARGKTPVMTPDGRYVAFVSQSGDQVPACTREFGQIIVRDRQANTFACASVSSAGVEANDGSSAPSISSDGRYVAFQSNATDLVPGGGIGVFVFVHDMQTGTTTKASVPLSGAPVGTGFHGGAPSISADGRYVAFESDATNLVAGDTNDARDIFVHDMQTGQNQRVSTDSSGTQSNGHSNQALISGNGRYVVYTSFASNLVPGDTDGDLDLFVSDTQTGQTTRVNVSSAGAQANHFNNTIMKPPGISADGRFVVFDSTASNLVATDANGFGWDVFLHDRQSGQTTLLSGAPSPALESGGVYPAVSSNGRYVTFIGGDGWFNGDGALLVHDSQSGKTSWVSPNANGPNPVSDNGRLVAFWTSTKLVSDGRTETVYVADLSGSSIATAPFLRGSTEGSSTTPRIEGVAVKGARLKAHPNSWLGSRAIAFAFQWRRCDAAAGNCVDIAGATQSSYEVGSSDVGSRLRFNLTATTGGGSTTLGAFTSTALVVDPAPHAGELPTISGPVAPHAGDALTVGSNGTWVGNPTTFAYQWRRCADDGSTCTNIAGATGSLYTLAVADVGKAIRLSVTASNAGGSGVAASPASATIGAATGINAPSQPTGVSATPGDTSATVSFGPPASSGSAPITSYTATASPGGASATGTTSPIVVTGLTNGITYTFSVTASSSAGTSPPSNASNPVTPIGLPGPPTDVTGVGSDGQVTVSFVAPPSAGSPITGYTVTAFPGGQTATGTTSPIVVTGLTNFTSYTFTVTATNAFGTGIASAPSASVTPAPFRPHTDPPDALPRPAVPDPPVSPGIRKPPPRQ